MEALTKEFEYYKENQSKLVKLYRDKFIVIVGESVVGSYDSEEDAILKSLENYKLGEFLVQYVESGEDNITQTFHSRVMFNAFK